MATYLALIKKNPILTPEEFSKYWRTRQAYIVIPYFMNRGMQYYSQVHNPEVSSKVFDAALADKIRTFDGGIELILSKDLPEQPAWMKAYHEEVIVGDEKKFLVGEALEHIKWVGTGCQEGDKLVVIEDGDVKVEVPEEFWDA